MNELTEFLLARIAEDESEIGFVHNDECAHNEPPGFPCDCRVPERSRSTCEAMRRIVELHRDWPVLVERPVEFEPSFGADLPFAEQVTYRASRQIAWMTEQEYRNRFGDEPPTGPILRALASVYAEHPDYREEWRP